MVTLTDWATSVDGRYLDLDGVAGPQCWDAVQAYMTAFGYGTLWTVPGATQYRGYAAGSVEGYGKNGLEKVFDLIPGTQPGQPGDVVVWAYGQPSFPTSHNGVLIEDRDSSLYVVSQNSSPVEPDAPGYNPDAVKSYGTTGPTRTQTLPRGQCWFLRPKTPVPITAPAPAPQKGPAVAPFNLDRMADILTKYGLSFIEEPGWKTRGYAGQDLQAYGGMLWHHTASNRASYAYNPWPSGNILVNGRSDLPGPLCNLSIDRNGIIRVVATGVANHAGTGYGMGIVPPNMGNHYLVGVEIESSGVAPFDLTPTMMDVAVTLGAVVELEFGQGLAPENRLQVFHLEYSDAGKIDLFGWPGGPDGFRTAVNDTIAQIQRGGTIAAPSKTPAPPTTTGDWLDMATKEEVKAEIKSGVREVLQERYIGGKEPYGAGSIGWAVYNARLSALNASEQAKQAAANTGPIIRGGQPRPLRQEVADTLTTSAKIAADNIGLTAQVTALAATVETLAKAQGLDPATIQSTITTAVDQALTGLAITRKAN